MKEHQVADWRAGHKGHCGKPELFYDNGFLFDEFELVCEDFEKGKEVINSQKELTLEEAEEESKKVEQTLNDVEDNALENEAESTMKVSFDYVFA